VAQHTFPITFVRFFLSVLFVYLCVWLWQIKTRLLFCCLLATLAIMLSDKKKIESKMWSNKWYLKRNISCNTHLLNELLERDVPWDDAIVASTGKLKKMWDSLGKLHSSACERRLEKIDLTLVLLPFKTAQFTHFFNQVWHDTVKMLSLTERI